jgi:hypothetical protein
VLGADAEPPPATQPGPGPLDPPAVTAQPGCGLDPAAGDPRADAAPTQVGAAAAVIVGLVGVDCARPSPPPAGGMRIAGMSSRTASSMVESLALAALTRTVNGSSSASPARCSLDPALPRSTGLAPHRSPL